MLGSEVVTGSRWLRRSEGKSVGGLLRRQCGTGVAPVVGHRIVGAVGCRVVRVRFDVSVGSVGRSRIRNEGQDDSPAQSLEPGRVRVGPEAVRPVFAVHPSGGEGTERTQGARPENRACEVRGRSPDRKRRRPRPVGRQTFACFGYGGSAPIRTG